MAFSLARLVRSKADRWLFRLDVPDTGTVSLSRRRVFIVPARAGAGFLALMLVLLIGSINYSLGLGYALTFTVGACAVVDMIFTNRNLVGLRLSPGRAAPVFAGEEARFELNLANPTARDRYAVWLDRTDARVARHVADVPAHGKASVVLAVPTSQRGWLDAPRLRLSTRFPLGLFRAWAYWRPDTRILVYPYPEAVAPPLPMASRDGSDGGGGAGNEDFAGIRSYQAGDPLRRLAWRQIARLDPELGGQLVTKNFEGGSIEDLVLDFSLLPRSLGLEQRLSRMTRWVLDAESRALPYAFRLDGTEFPPAVGEAHRAACLRALALYGAGGERA
ncbi:MAG TPA: DUF58 domain-containing protein [Telluria sp.]